MFDVGMIMLGVVIVLSTALTVGLRFRAKRWWLKRPRATYYSVSGVPLPPASASLNAPSWESLLQIVDWQ